MTSFEPVAIVPIFIASLIGSPHCAGMCGGFVALYSHSSPKNFYAHSLYNLGRLTTYLLLGASAALLGSTLDQTIPIARFSAFFVGIALVISGLLKLFEVRLEILRPLHTAIGRLTTKLAKATFDLSNTFKPFVIGLITTFLPCGWLYTFVALALASSNMLSALTIMFAFWLGTLPIMLAVGVLAKAMTSGLGKYLPRVTAILLIIGGLFSLTAHLQHTHHSDHSHGQSEHHQHNEGMP